VSHVQANPSAPDFDRDHYLFERYVGGGEGQAPLVRAYYTVKPLLPRHMQLLMRRRYARRQAKRTFPAWPIETILVDHMHAGIARRLEETGQSALPMVNFWPNGKRFCAIVSHDVEGPAGIENIPRVLEVEQRHGIVSSWNFVAEDYEIPNSTFAMLRDAGCEIGLHGIHHDGMLFRDRAHFEADLPAIHRYLEEWGAVGFRSPATHRNPDWMPELGCLYDGSFPDTDPFEPQSGGCCSVFPYFLGEMVELPITLVQDHTLWEILGDRSTSRWVEKSEWIIRNRGLIQLLVHPDYVIDDDSLAIYDEFLAYLARHHGEMWHALPREVAEWWRRRENLSVEPSPTSEAHIVGDDPTGATVVYAREGEDGGIRFDAEARDAA
jgi:peptidoglycan/xylan/chitin deacetylase (PgdA/CDA1 family)